MIKPLQLQLAADHPELLDNKEVLEAISIQFKSYNTFEELMEMELMQKRVDFIQSMKESMVDMDVEGNEIKFFSSKFLVEKYLKLSPQDISLNEKYKKEEIEELNLAGDSDNGYDDSNKNESFEDLIANLTEDEKTVIKAHIKKQRKKKAKKKSEEE